MKKLMIIASLCAFMMVTPVSTPVLNTVWAESVSEFTKQELKDMGKVDKALKKLVKSEKYQSGDLKTKKKLAKKLLKKLKSKGLIKNIFYSDKTYSFQYKNGVLGGLMLEEFSEFFN